MPSRSSFDKRLIAANEDEFGLHYLGLKFPGRQKRNSAEARREQLLAELGSSLHWTADDSKPYLGKLSLGCRRCVEGSWSCLFVNNRCNASCFYCPTSQQNIDIPATNNLSFRHPDGYATYLQRLGFNGASVSGGEPLLTLKRSLAYLRAARRALGPKGHLWLYTNGILLTREIAAQLAEAGLDEIRFDIGATGYRTERIAMAAGLIPTITVEIPAIPESLPLLKQQLPVLAQLGVAHLNLHQLRLTRHNFDQLTRRNYTYLHGEKVTVLESELAALEIMAFVRQQKLKIGVNYCSFAFKNRHQKAAARRRAARLEVRPWESVTRAGLIRKLELLGEPARLRRQVERWRQAGHKPSRWYLDELQGRLQFAPALLPQIDWSRVKLAVSYDQVQLGGRGLQERGDWQLPLGPDEPAWVVRQPTSPELLLGRSAALRFGDAWLQPSPPLTLPAGMKAFAEWEQVPRGLQRYF